MRKFLKTSTRKPMDIKTESEHLAATDDTYPDPHSHLTTLTAPSTTTLMDMVSYGNPTITTSYQDIHPASSASHHHQATTAHYYPHPHHPSDYAADWQQTAVAAAAAAAVAAGGAGATASPTTDPSNVSTAAPFYSFADRPDLASVQLYHHHHHTFPGGTVPHGGDLYPPTPSTTLWHVPQSLAAAEDPSVNVLGSAQRYLPGMTSGRTSGPPSGSSSSSSASNSSGSNTTTSGKPKRRRVQSLPQRKAANIRERRRMFHLNTAFDELRKRLPAFNYEKRLSRIETLRLAMTYIGFMKDVSLGEDPRKVKLRPGMTSDTGSDLSHLDLESVTSEDASHEDVES